jgi:hypothetical protein
MVVRETLLSAGIDAPELDRMAARVTCPTDHHGSCGPTPGPTTTPYVKVILESAAERQRWRRRRDESSGWEAYVVRDGSVLAT